MVGEQALQGACRFGVVLGEDGRDEGRHDAPGLVVDGDVRGHRNDASGLAHLLDIGRIQPEIGSVADALDLVVDLAAEPRELALEEPRSQCLRRRPAGLRAAREVEAWGENRSGRRGAGDQVRGTGSTQRGSSLAARLTSPTSATRPVFRLIWRLLGSKAADFRALPLQNGV